MSRYQGVILAVAAVAVLGACASAGQPEPAAPVPSAVEENYPPGLAEPEDNEFTTRAGLLLAQAAGAEDEAMRAQRGREALAIVQQGLQQDTLNPKLWLMKGQAEVAAGMFEDALGSFERALEIYPAYEPQIEAEREQAWVQAFNAGVAAMNEQNVQEAIRQFEQAQVIYDVRPEALLNLASLYLNQDQPERAIEAYERTLEIVDDPAGEELPEEIRADWPRFRELARTNMAQIYASMGVEHFRAEEYDAAAEDFRAALEINPYYRDALHNLAQALYVRSTELEEQREAAPEAERAAIEQELREVYAQFRDASEQVLEIDPFNQNVHLLVARAYRGLGQLAQTEEERRQMQQRALEILEANRDLPFQITNVQVQLGDSAVQVAGDLENLNMAEGEQVTLRITMVTAEGESAGAETVTITTPPQGGSASFSLSVPVTQAVLGWRYERVEPAAGPGSGGGRG